MKSAQILNGNSTEITIQEDEVPHILHEDEVIIKVTLAGVCHTDIHLRDHGYDMGNNTKLTFAERGIKYPITPGKY
jgi:D-arabinose 1-dehydrogenase-like Zn-dependent alcohol dehydrogenase